MAVVVGEAEILVHANTAGVESEIRDGAAGAYPGVASDAAKAGDDAGAALAGGMGTAVERESGAIEAKGVEAGNVFSRGVKSASSKAGSVLQSFGVPPGLTQGWGGAALAIGAVGAVALDMGAKMQSADTKIANSANISVKAATAIGDAFLTTGGQVEFSGREMADAYAQVAGQLGLTNGAALTTAQSLTFMKQASDLATASSVDLGTATSTLAGIVQAFKIPLDQVNSATDILYNTSRVTGQGIDTVGAALERLKTRLGGAAPPLADMATLMVDMAKQGLTGRASLTAVTGALSALQGAIDPTSKTGKTAAAVLHEYGLSAVDATGHLTSLRTIIDVLGPKFATMTQAQQLETAAAIFGTTAAKGMTAVIDGSVKSWTAASDAVTKHNAVQQAAARNSATLSGEWKILKAELSDVATKLGEALIPAFTTLLRVILPVIDAVVKLADWFMKGSPAAIALASAVGLILLPSLIKLGVGFVETAAKAVTSFVTMGNGIKGFGATAQTTSAEVVTANEEAAASFSTISEGVAADIPMIGTEMATMATEVEGADATIVAANEGAAASFSAMLGPIGAVAAAGVGAFLATSSLLNKLKEMYTVKPSTSAGAGTLSQEQIVEAYDKAHGISTKGLFSQGETALGPGVFKAADEWYKKMQKEKEKAAEKAAGRAAAAADAFQPIPTTSTTAHHSKAAASAAHKAAQAALHAQNTLASEVIKALSLPHAEAARQLELLGVPAKKAAQVLHDATLPFTEAVKALERAGFDASNAVKIADAEQKKNATKTGTKGKGTLPTGFTVNGMPVGGFDLGPGQVEAAATAASGFTGSSTTTAPTLAATAPTKSPPSAVVVKIEAGAVVINPAPGNDHSGTLATKSYIETALRTLAREIESGVANFSQVTR